MLVTKEPRRYRIECSNWPDFAAECSVELDIYHSSDCLHIHYYVDEPAVVANCGKDMEHVWEDSCVEFFFEPVHNGVYFNVECNCIGVKGCPYRKRHWTEYEGRAVFHPDLSGSGTTAHSGI